jgi:subtilisin family serine protease
MNKIVYFLCTLAVIPSLLLVTSIVNAKSQTVVHLDIDQKVIIRNKNDSKNAKEIGKSGFYITTIKDLNAANIDINMISDYRALVAANDPNEPQEYLTLLDSGTFWDNVPDSSEIVVADIDGGYALDHEDMLGRWALNNFEMGTTAAEGVAPNCTSRGMSIDKKCNNIDDDDNGYTDDWRGWDFAQSDNDPQAGTVNPTSAYIRHGSETAGLIGITGNNSIGAASLNWHSKILPLQVFTDEGMATTSELSEAIDYAIARNVDVINLSLGSSSPDSTVESLLQAANEAGIVVVSAAGNCGGSNYVYNGCDYEGQMLYPASSDYTIAVGSSDPNDYQSEFSSRGLKLDLLAPGSGPMISSSYQESDEVSSYSDYLYGTSFAAPVVTGLVAVLKAQWPSATPGDLRAVLVDTAIKTPDMGGSLYTQYSGFGRVRPLQALDLASRCESITTKSDINCDEAVDLLDLSLLASQWSKQYTGRTDSNSSGLVDLLDLSLLASQWGQLNQTGWGR